MKLKKVLEGLDYQVLAGDLDKNINGVEQDSRKIKKDNLFVAVEGFTVDGHDYIDKAVINGAQAIIVTKDIDLVDNVTTIRVEDDKEALARVSANFYDKPSEKLNLIGITGTNGKTTISYMLKSILDQKCKNVGLIGTMGSIINNKKIDNKNTTPESIEIQEQISRMVEGNSEYCLMEVSSHSLEMKRVDNLEFKVGIFTNLTEDHLDYHENMKNYFASKKKLFKRVIGLNIINKDDPYGASLIDEIKDLNTNLITYGLSRDADIFAKNIRCHNKGVNYTLCKGREEIDISMNLLGEFNIYNSLAAAACANYFNYTLSEIKKGLESIEGVKGRFELVPIEEDFSVIIDFAHTPDGLKQVLKTTRDFSDGNIIVVFGAGGDRDSLKRPIMGETVGRYSDIPIITSDNPRYEKPEDIIEDIAIGVKKVNDNYITLTDRKDAIEKALRIAKKGDTVILAGKGHETYISIKGETIPFNEKEIVLEIISKLRREKDAIY